MLRHQCHRVVFWVAFATVLLSGGFADVAKGADKAPSNVVIILADDLGYGDLGCYGATKIPTPNIDRFAQQSVRCTSAYGPAATCTPSRYSLLTGEYAWRQPAKKTNILNGDAPLNIDPGRVTLPSMLKQAGYATALVGKWHLGLGDGTKPIDFNGEISPGPLEVGFDQAFFMPATVDRVPCVFIDGHHVAKLDASDPIQINYDEKVGDDPTGLEKPDSMKVKADKQHSGTIINGISRIGFMAGGQSARWVDEDIAQTLTDHAKSFIESNREKPFMLYLGLHDPHVPRAPAQRFRGKSGVGIRGDAIVEIDWAIGEITDELDRLKLADSTLLIVTSDNGPVLFDGYYDGALEANDGHTPAGGLRGAKYKIYEGGTRVPFIARLPGRIKPGVSDGMISLTDMLATCAALADQKLPSGAGPDSINLLPMLLGEPNAPQRDAVVQQAISGCIAIRAGDWKYVESNADQAVSGIGAGANPTDDRFNEAIIKEPELFNLKDDPAESKNLAKERTEKLEELKKMLEKIRKQH